MKTIKLSLLVFLTTLVGFKQLKACHGMPLQNYLVTVGATGVTVTANSDPSTCGCGPYWLQTEISCTPVFQGTQPACLTSTLANWNNPATSYLNYPYYNSLLNVPNYNIASGWIDNCVLEPYRPNVIPFSNLCPGKTYYIRSREMVLGGGNTGPWTAVQSFVVPGTPVVNPPNSLNMTLNASPSQIICCGPVQLTAVITGTNWGQCLGNVPSCERNVTVTPTFSWTSSNPVNTTIGNGTTFTTSTNVLSVTNLTSTTTFSVWLTYLCSSPSGTIMYTPPSVPIIFTNLPLSSSNITNTFVTAASNAVWTQALTACLSGAPCMCNFLSAQPAVVTVQVLSMAPPLSVTMTPNTCLSSPNFTFTDISASGPNFNHFWNFGDGGTGTGANVVHTYTAAGIYTVTVMKAGCGPCAANASYTVQVYPAPNAILSVNSPICIGGTASFTNTVSNGVSYSWTGPNSFTSSIQNPLITNVTAAMAGVYTCVTTNANVCTGTSTINLATYQATMTANANSPVCLGSTLNLTASGSGSYSWTGPNNFSSTQHNPSFIAANNSAGNYLVFATLTGNCYANANVNVSIISTTITANNNSPACSGNNVQLNAYGNGSFAWVGPNGFTSNLQNPTINNATQNANGIYTVTITSPQGCVATATTNVWVNGSQVLNPSATPVLCEGGTIYLETKDGSGVTYQWQGPNGFVSNKANVGVLDATPLNTGTYIVTLIDAGGCSATGTVAVLVNPKPNVDIDMSKAISGCAPVNNVEFNAVTNSLVGINFSWTLGNGSVNTTSNPKNINYPNAGTYTVGVIATDAKGCTIKINKVLEVYPVPVVSFSNTIGNWTNPMINFTDMSTNGNITSWHWTFGIGADVYSTIQHPNYNYPDSGSYNVTLKVKTDKGCENMLMKKVYIADESSVFIPNAFSPNGDGQNDVFTVIGNSVTKFEMLIFNRGGNLVFKSTDINKGWDGTFKGQVSENNAYVYKISYVGKDSKSHTASGSVTLVK
jgi:gliding motility-associated-like protein